MTHTLRISANTPRGCFVLLGMSHVMTVVRLVKTQTKYCSFIYSQCNNNTCVRYIPIVREVFERLWDSDKEDLIAVVIAEIIVTDVPAPATSEVEYICQAASEAACNWKV